MRGSRGGGDPSAGGRTGRNAIGRGAVDGDRPGGGRTGSYGTGAGHGRTLQRDRPEAGGGRGSTPPGSSSAIAGRDRQAGYGHGGRGGGGRGGGPGGPDGPDGGRRSFRQWLLYGSWWRRWTWKKALAVFAGACLTLVVLVVGAFFVAYAKTPLPSDKTATALAVPSQVFYSNGKPMATFTSGNFSRKLIPQQQMPRLVENAIIAAEDRHFYSEGGISPTGIIRAAYADIKGGGYAQGGSTITEQFVKNYYSGFTVNNSDKSASIKFKEILAAIKLAHQKSKPWILSEYLNTVYFGQGAYGIGAAAETYFGKSASHLTVSQAAMLAAMVNQPSYFSPDKNAGPAHTALVQRYQYVLSGMVIDGVLPGAKADALKLKFPKVHYHLGSNLNGYRGYLMQMVNQELTSTYHLTQAQIDSGGLKIYTSFSPSLMKGLYKSVAAAKLMMKDDGQSLPSYAHVGAVVEDPGTGEIKAVYGGPGYGVKHCAKVYCYLNMAEDPKQVGSSFKPYVLATAVSQGMNVQDSVLNGYSPLWIPEGQSAAERQVLSSRTKPVDPQQGYLPFDEAGENSGPLPVAKAAAISSDPAFEDLAHRAGVQNVIDMTQSFGVGQSPFELGNADDWKALNDQFGIHSKKETAGSVAIALGEGELTSIEQASTFATLANGGTYISPHVVAKIVRGGVAVPLKVVRRQVLTASQAADVDYALSFDNVPGGTAYPDAAWPGRSVIAKTGTTQTAQDAWFLGAIPQYSMGVALFTNKQDSVSSAGSQTLDVLPTLPGNSAGGYGGAWPAEIWHVFMSTEFADLTPAAFATPDYTGFTKWDQVGAAPVTPTPTPTPGIPTPTPTPTCTPTPGQACLPVVSPTPTPTPTTPPPVTPSPTCTPSPGQQCPPGTAPGQGNGNATTAVITRPAGEASALAALLRVRVE